jgi:hypothetical protein
VLLSSILLTLGSAKTLFANNRNMPADLEVILQVLFQPKGYRGPAGAMLLHERLVALLLYARIRKYAPDRLATQDDHSVRKAGLGVMMAEPSGVGTKQPVWLVG